MYTATEALFLTPALPKGLKQPQTGTSFSLEATFHEKKRAEKKTYSFWTTFLSFYFCEVFNFFSHQTNDELSDFLFFSSLVSSVENLFQNQPKRPPPPLYVVQVLKIQVGKNKIDRVDNRKNCGLWNNTLKHKNRLLL